MSDSCLLFVRSSHVDLAKAVGAGAQLAEKEVEHKGYTDKLGHYHAPHRQKHRVKLGDTGAPVASPKAEEPTEKRQAKPAAPAHAAQPPTDQQLAGDKGAILAHVDSLIQSVLATKDPKNTNIKTFKSKLEKMRSMVAAGDFESLTSTAWGVNTYGKAVAKLAAAAAKLMVQEPQPTSVKDSGAGDDKPAEPPAPVEGGAVGALRQKVDELGGKEAVAAAIGSAMSDEPTKAVADKMLDELAGAAGVPRAKVMEEVGVAQPAKEQEGAQDEPKIMHIDPDWKMPDPKDTVYTEDQLQAAGGNQWVNPSTGATYHYFNGIAGMLGLKCVKFGTGNILSATLHGKRISNSSAEKMLKDLWGAKFYYNDAVNTFQSKNLTDQQVQVLTKLVMEKLEAAKQKAEPKDGVLATSPKAEPADAGEKSELKERAPASSPNDEPKEGDIKPGADGPLVFKDGRWHKMGEDEKADDAQQAAPADVFTLETKDGKVTDQALAGNKKAILNVVDDWISKALAKLDPGNKNLPSFKAKLAKLRQMAADGDIKGLTETHWGVNTYGKVAAKLAPEVAKLLQQQPAKQAPVTAPEAKAETTAAAQPEPVESEGVKPPELSQFGLNESQTHLVSNALAIIAEKANAHEFDELKDLVKNTQAKAEFFTSLIGEDAFNAVVDYGKAILAAHGVDTKAPVIVPLPSSEPDKQTAGPPVDEPYLHAISDEYLTGNSAQIAKTLDNWIVGVLGTAGPVSLEKKSLSDKLSLLRDLVASNQITAIKNTDWGKSDQGKQVAKLAAKAVALLTPKVDGGLDSGPHDGDTKEGAEGSLVFFNGRWHKVEQPGAEATSQAGGQAEPAAASGQQPEKAATAGPIAPKEFIDQVPNTWQQLTIPVEGKKPITVDAVVFGEWGFYKSPDKSLGGWNVVHVASNQKVLSSANFDKAKEACIRLATDMPPWDGVGGKLPPELIAAGMKIKQDLANKKPFPAGSDPFAFVPKSEAYTKAKNIDTTDVSMAVSDPLSEEGKAAMDKLIAGNINGTQPDGFAYAGLAAANNAKYGYTSFLQVKPIAAGLASGFGVDGCVLIKHTEEHGGDYVFVQKGTADNHKGGLVTDPEIVKQEALKFHAEKAIEKAKFDDELQKIGSIASPAAMAIYGQKTVHAMGMAKPSEKKTYHEGSIKTVGAKTYILKNGHWNLLYPEEVSAMVKAECESLALPSTNRSWSHHAMAENLKKAAIAGKPIGKFIKQMSDGTIYVTDGYGYKVSFNKKNIGSESTKIANDVFELALKLKAIQAKYKGGAASPKQAGPKAPAAAPAAAADYSPSDGSPTSHKPWVAKSADGWTAHPGTQKGSNPGGEYTDDYGNKMYVKFPESEEHARNEVLASKLYQLAGIAGPKLKVVTIGGKIGVASKWVDGLSKVNEDIKHAAGAIEGFGVDAWLGNYDAVGTGFDNLLKDKDGAAVRIDVGGSLLFRAQGKPKGDMFGDKVDEIEKMRDPKANHYAAQVFGGMTRSQLNHAVARVLMIDDAAIDKYVAVFGPGSAEDRKALADKLIARKNDLKERFPDAEKIAHPPPPDTTKLQVDPEKLPKLMDFHNWKDTGKGLSSVEAINSANQDAVDQIYKVALTGNMEELKKVKVRIIDKSTGAVSHGEPAEHPSKWVKDFYGAVMDYMDVIANPSAEVHKKYVPIDADELQDLDTLFPAHEYGITAGKVPANERLGFWLSLGNVIDSAPFDVWDKKHWVSKKDHAKGKASNQGIPSHLRSFMQDVKASSQGNFPYREGKEYDLSGNKCVDVIKAAYDHAMELEEGSHIQRDIWFPANMAKLIMEQPDGHVFENPGSMCTSLKPNWTWESDDVPTNGRLEIVCAKGAKALYNIGVGAFDNEGEITTLPGQRFMILNKSYQGKRPVLRLLLLPPDPTYVTRSQQKFK